MSEQLVIECWFLSEIGITANSDDNMSRTIKSSPIQTPI